MESFKSAVRVLIAKDSYAATGVLEGYLNDPYNNHIAQAKKENPAKGAAMEKAVVEIWEESVMAMAKTNAHAANVHAKDLQEKRPDLARGVPDLLKRIAPLYTEQETERTARETARTAEANQRFTGDAAKIEALTPEQFIARMAGYTPPAPEPAELRAA